MCVENFTVVEKVHNALKNQAVFNFVSMTNRVGIRFWCLNRCLDFFKSYKFDPCSNNGFQPVACIWQ
jgi:hypothetical protein